MSFENGAGLSTDLRLLRSVLEPAGYQVRFWDFRDPDMPPCDLAVFVETLAPPLVPATRRTAAIVNAEYLTPEARTALDDVDEVWTKTLELHHKLTDDGVRCHYTGFLAEDLYDPSTPRALECVHVAGYSSAKGTEEVLRAWQAHPQLPPLHLVAGWDLTEKTGWPDDEVMPAGVLRHHWLERDQLAALMNRCLIHVCPSRAEGWGHHIAEGLLMGAAVVTTDASPMHEHVRPEWGH
ncbi:glycosyltransferase, partial [Streptomyces noursei]|uniref:glycosyltransferase n=1 Tax=Streptomyces noursei TaxID=1971 RepID=UPI003450D725